MPSARQPTKVFLNHLPFLSKQYSSVLLDRISTVINSAVFFQGPEVSKLEKSLEKFLTSNKVFTVGSGHDALVIALQALDLKKSDEVIFPVNAYPTAFALAQVNCTLKPIDCDEHGQLSFTELKKSLNSRTKAIVVVHMYGSCCDMTKLMRLAKKAGVKVIEDCAQAFGSSWQGKKLGTFGSLGCYSFYPTKNLGTAGDGGAITVNDPKLEDFCCAGRQYGEKVRYNSSFIAGHSRLPEIQAAVLNVYFSKLKKLSLKKKKVLEWYQRELEFIDTHSVRLLLPKLKDLSGEVHLFVAEVARRDELLSFLHTQHIEAGIHYPIPVHLTQAFKFLKYKQGDFPIAEQLSRGIISLPFHSYLKKDDVVRVTQSIKKFYA